MATFGPLLRRTREQRGVSLDDVARETRLSKRYLIALEEEAIAKLPGGTYNRAYLKTYATFLALEPDAVLRDYQAEESRQSAASQQDLLETMNRAIDKRQAVANVAGQKRTLPSWALGAAAAVLVVAALGGATWYALDRGALGAIDIGASALSTPAPVLPPPAVGVPVAPEQPRTEPAPPAAVPAEMPAVPSGRPDAVLPETPLNTATAVPGAPEPAASEQTEPASGHSASDRGGAERPAVEPAVADGGHANGSHLSISGSGVGTAIVDRQLVGQADRFTAGSRVVFWTHIVGGKAGDTIDHVWLRDGSVVGAASLSVGSPDWRTQSRRVVDPAGHWVVEARDADGRVLARHEFQTSDQ